MIERTFETTEKPSRGLKGIIIFHRTLALPASKNHTKRTNDCGKEGIETKLSSNQPVKRPDAVSSSKIESSHRMDCPLEPFIIYREWV
jgi:hypothetical protein